MPEAELESCRCIPGYRWQCLGAEGCHRGEDGQILEGGRKGLECDLAVWVEGEDESKNPQVWCLN